MDLPGINAAEANNRGLAAFNRGDMNRAIAEFNAAVNINPSFAIAFLNRGIALLQMRNFEHVIADVTWAMHLGLEAEHTPLAREVRAAAAVGLGSFANALYDLDPLAEHFPAEGRIHLLRGIALYRSLRFAEATAELSAALGMSLDGPQTLAARVALAWSRLASADIPTAFGELNEAVRIAPGAEVLFARGICLLIARRYGEALADFLWVVAAAPNHAAAALMAARILACAPDPAVRDGNKAVDIANRLCHLTAWKDLPAINALAAAFAEQGDWPSAVNWGQRAVALAPNDAACVSRLALFGRGQTINEDIADVWPAGEIPPWAQINAPGLG